jgi:tetratricopeptide (TPR) repeat protein
LKKAIRLNPIKPLNYLNNLAWAYNYSEQYEQAILIWKQCVERNPDYLFAHMDLTLAFRLSGNENMARKSAQEVLRIKPDLTVSKIKKGAATKNIDRKRVLEEFRKAGIPD